VTRIERYTPYGEPGDGVMDQGPGYTGHVTDALTGLSYAQQRYYDPLLGRFLSPDPVETDPNSGGNFNRYWYANNNPYRYTDPDGRRIKYLNYPSNQATRDQILEYINTLAAGRYVFDENDDLQRVGDSTSTDPRSLYYDQRLQEAIQHRNTIKITQQPELGGESTSSNGQGLTGRGQDRRTVYAAISGNPLETTDSSGNPLVDSPARVLMHEMLGHSIPILLGERLDQNAVDLTNRAREELGIPLERYSPNDTVVQPERDR
jgi:RHS repeat-associated protein